jgi:uncharacterized protein YyaL (SSP411 family)
MAFIKPYLTLFVIAAVMLFGIRPLSAGELSAGSPYLRQHADDAVKWHSWGDAAFEKARKLKRPIYLSIGYSACHWCHVMQEESFTNPVIAKILNENYVPILVDRERRPDIDEIYMLATEAISGQGGWPNNLILTPEKEPVFGAVYIPPDALQNLLTGFLGDWASNQIEIRAEAKRVSGLLSQFLNRKLEAAEITPKILSEAASALAAKFDQMNGGIGTAPKYFRPPVLRLLLQHAERTGSNDALEAVEITLKAGAHGGIHDHLAGGFHRYAVDPAWRVPHFEKMLYDQALMVSVYTHAYRLTGNPLYAQIARKTLDYVLADLTSPEGGFFSTRDADTDGVEGAFYVWTEQEFAEILGPEEGKFATDLFEVQNEGELEGKIVLNLDHAEPGMEQRISTIFSKLHAARKKRTPPARDEKIITAWNGLMIAAMADGATELGDDKFRKAAVKAAQFLWHTLYSQNSQSLSRISFAGQASVDATLNDYAFATLAMSAIYDLTGEAKWLERAETLAKRMNQLFGDADAGDFYMTAALTGFARAKLRGDSDIPSGNAIAFKVNSMLSRRSLTPEFRHRADAALAALSGHALSDVVGGASILSAAQTHLFGQSGNLQYAARGAVRVAARLSDDQRNLILDLVIRPGWHINAHKPLEQDFIPTTLTFGSKNTDVFEVKYPEPVHRKLGFHDEELALYEGRTSIRVDLPKTLKASGKAALEVQACSDSLCLQPESLTFRLPGKK